MLRTPRLPSLVAHESPVVAWLPVAAPLLVAALLVVGPTAAASATSTTTQSPSERARGPEEPSTRVVHEAEGPVVVVSGHWSLPLDVARRVCADPTSRVRVTIGDPRPEDVDVLANLGSATPTLALRTGVDHPGDDPALASRVRAARCVVLEGGTWVDWWRALEPWHKTTELGRAVLDARASGAAIVAVGAAGAYVSERSLISRALLQRPSRDPHDLEEHVLATGFDLVDGVCLDMAIDGRTTPEAMLDRLTTSDATWAVWLDGEAAWIQDGRGRHATVATGRGRALVFDLSCASRSRHDLRDGRLFLLDGRSSDASATTHDLDLRARGLTSTYAAAMNPTDVAWFPDLARAERGEFRGHLGRLSFRRAPAAEGQPASPLASFDWREDPATR